MHIGLDFDGTIADHTVAKLLLARELGVDLALHQTASEALKTVMPSHLYQEFQKRLYGELSHMASPLPYAHGVIARLVREGHAISIVSRRGSDSQDQARAWLLRNFQGLISLRRIYFVAKDQEKNDVCKAKRISVFLDDQAEVLSYLASVRRRFLIDPFAHLRIEAPQSVTVVPGWSEFYRMLLRPTVGMPA